MKLRFKLGLTLLALFLVFSFDSYSQNPCLEVVNARGCAPLTVRVNDCSGADPDLVFYQFGDREPQRGNTFTFTEPGKYSVTQLINTGGSGGDSETLTNAVEVFAPNPLDFDVIGCSNSRIRINIKDNYYEQYFIDFGDGSNTVTGDKEVIHDYNSGGEFSIEVRGLFEGGTEEGCGTREKLVTVASSNSSSKPVVSRVNLFDESRVEIEYQLLAGLSHHLQKQSSDGTYSDVVLLSSSSSKVSLTAEQIEIGVPYRVVAIDPCSEDIMASELFYINNVVIEPINEGFNINWTPTPTGSSVERIVLLRNDLEEPLYEQTDNQNTSYTDENVLCQETYCYSMRIRLSSGTSLLTQQKCLVATSNEIPTSIDSVYISFNQQNKVFLNWKYPDDSSPVLAKVIRSDNSEEQIFSLANADTSFTDNSPNVVENAFCYALTYENECRVEALPTKSFCPVRLSGAKGENRIDISWTVLQGLSASNYEVVLTDSLGKEPIDVWNFSGAGSLSIPTENYQIQTVYLRVNAYLDDLDTISYSNFIEFNFESYLEYPNAFSPNGDNLNDTFGVQSRFIEDFRMVVLNRWGEAVFETNDVNERWDGRFRNAYAPVGEYTINIKAKDQLGKPYRLTEMLKLVR